MIYVRWPWGEYGARSSITVRCGRIAGYRCTNAPGGRLVSFYRGGYFNRAGTLAGSTRGKKLLRARQIIVEGVIGEAKSWHGLSRCRYRGLPRFEMQLLLTASVINLKRLLESPRPPALCRRIAKSGAIPREPVERNPQLAG